MPEGQTTAGVVAHNLRDPAAKGALQDLLLRSWWTRIWVPIAVVFGLVMWRLPLAGVLGYELALLANVLAVPTGLVVGIKLARRAGRVGAPALLRSRGPARLILALTWRAVVLAVAITAIPALLAALRGLWTPTCDAWFGLKAYVLLPLTTAALAAGAGVAIGLLSGHRTWIAVVSAIGLVAALGIACFVRFYTEPPVFLYSPLFGYFPGNLYDENIRLGAPLVWSRIEQVVWVAAALVATAIVLDVPTMRPRWRERRPSGWRWPARAVLTGTAALGVLFHLMSGRLGYAIDAEDIQAELGGVARTEHFVMYYADTSAITTDMDLVLEDLELRLAQVAETLAITDEELADLGTITAYVFASSEQKGRLIGARRVEMAKPWRKEIYLDADGFPYRAVRHELAHVVAGVFGSQWFRVAAGSVGPLPLMFNPGLIEGTAVAADWPGTSYRGALTPHQAMRAMQIMGIQPSVADVMSLGFLAFSSARSYTAAGSFVKFLLDEYGPQQLRRLYASGGEFDRVYGRSLRSLEAAWLEMIQSIELTEEQAEMVREQYRGTGVFSKPCPHAIAARQEEAGLAYARGDVAASIRLRRAVCSDAPDEPVYRLQLAESLLVGSEAQRAEAIEILDEIAVQEALTSSVRALALRMLAGVAAATQDWPTVEARLAAAYALPLGDEEARDLEARLFALRHTGPAAPALRGYFFDGATEADREAWANQATELEPTLGLAWYLRGFVHQDDPPAALTDLTTALDLPMPSARFVRNAARLLADAGWRADDRRALTRAIDLLDGPAMTEMDHLLAADLRWRQEWRSRRGR